MDPDRLTLRMQKVLERAQSDAAEKRQMLTPWHLLDALAHDEVVTGLGKRKVRRLAQAGKATADVMVDEGTVMTAESFDVLDGAQALADARHEPFVGPEHVLLALTQLGFGPASQQTVAERMTALHKPNIVNPWAPVPTPLELLTHDVLLGLEAQLHKRVIAQDRAIEAVASAVRRRVAGLADPGRPFGSFMFLGPTGVGKTELAKSVTEVLFGSELKMVRLDMSEYMEQHTVARMIGSPPGYVGYDEGGQLTELVSANPQTLVLFDEVEKAHPKVLDVLLQLLDDGQMTDGHGKTVDFHDVVVVMTSNVGSEVYRSMESTADERRVKVMDALWNRLRPEFLNRLDEIVVFDALTKEDFGQIVELQVAPVVQRMARRGCELTVTDEAMMWLADGGWNPLLGARQLRRFVQRELQNPLANAVLSGDVKGKVTVSLGDGCLEFGGLT